MADFMTKKKVLRLILVLSACLSYGHTHRPGFSTTSYETAQFFDTFFEIPEWVVQNWETKTSETGTWVASNDQYKNDRDPIDAYGIKWEHGMGKNHLTGRLFAIRDGEEIGSIWQFLEYWDPIENKLRITQIGSDGTVGSGETWQTDDGKLKQLQSFTTPEGNAYVSGHISWMENGNNQTQSYSVKGEEWTVQRFYSWELKKRSKEATIPRESNRIAYLIGKWILNLGEDQARMTFEWGKNKRSIFYKNEFKPKNSSEWQQENEGLIAYNGIKKSFVFLTAYSFEKIPLVANGEINFDEGGTIHRTFTCHYEEGTGLPWSNGEKAPKGGISIDFKQIWTPVNENSFKAEFYWNKNGNWESPMGPKKKEVVWTKVD